MAVTRPNGRPSVTLTTRHPHFIGFWAFIVTLRPVAKGCLGVLLTLVIGAGGCSHSTADKSDVPEVELPLVLPHVDMTTFVLPLDEYKLTPAESGALVD